MFGNKDEADKCLGLARKYLASGDHVKARKFALKADQLFPSEDAKRLLRDVDGRAGDCNINTDENAGAQQTRHRTTSAGGGSNTDKCYTQEQVDSVQRIRHSKDFYEILSVDKDASDDDLKRSYKRLALKFHPDKNKAPGATEAFKMIGKAFAVLSDPEKRKQYDHTGSVDDVQPRMRNGFTAHEYYDYSRGFETDFSAEELFNIFFGTGNLSGFTARTARHRPTPTQEREQSNYAWVQFLPLLFLFCMSLFSGLFVRDPIYQLHRTDKYSVERHTGNLHVPYFVKTTFEQEHGRSAANLQQLDREVETDYVNDLRYKCLNEKQQKESLIFRARYYGDEENYKRYSKMTLPSCQRLEAIYG